MGASPPAAARSARIEGRADPMARIAVPALHRSRRAAAQTPGRRVLPDRLSPQPGGPPSRRKRARRSCPDAIDLAAREFRAVAFGCMTSATAPRAWDAVAAHEKEILRTRKPFWPAQARAPVFSE